MEVLVNDPGRWRGRRVFLTGHTGFKGGWLAWMLARLGARLHGYALPPLATAPCFYAETRVASVLEGEHLADVRDAAALTDALHAARPEVVFHLAAQPLVRASYAAPAETFATNVMGTVHLLDAVRRCDSVRAVVVVTSDKCYRDIDRLDRPCIEADALGGHDPYSASKAAAEIVSASFAAAYGLPARGVGVATARAGNVFGGGDAAEDRLLPDLLRAIDAGTPPRLRNPGAVRPWQHVLEPLTGYVQLAAALLQAPERFSGAWNFGPAETEPVAVGQIAARLVALARAGGAVVAEPQARAAARPAVHESASPAPHEAARLLLDSTQARSRLGWRPQLTLDDALALTWQWHAAWRATGADSPPRADMTQTTLRQINAYAARADAAAHPTLPIPA